MRCALITLVSVGALGCGQAPTQASSTRTEPAASPEPRTATPTQSHLDLLVRAGFTSRDEIIARIVEGRDPSAEVIATVDARLAAHVASQTSWPHITDADRLVRAFSALDAAGLLARHSYGISGPEALQLISMETAAQCAARREVRGYVFYDAQAAETVTSGWLELTWEAYRHQGWTAERYESEAEAIGEAIVQTLRQEGLSVHGGHSLGVIRLVDLDWKARRNPTTFEPAFVDLADEEEIFSIDTPTGSETAEPCNLSF